MSFFFVLLSEIDDSQIGLVSPVACQDRPHFFTNFELETPTHEVSEFSNGLKGSAVSDDDAIVFSARENEVF